MCSDGPYGFDIRNSFNDSLRLIETDTNIKELIYILNENQFKKMIAIFHQISTIKLRLRIAINLYTYHDHGKIQK